MLNSKITALLALMATMALCGWSRSADAYCRSTTCSGDCNRNADGCKTEGKPLYWPTLCMGFSLQKDGSQHIDMPIWREVAFHSFAAWVFLDCGNGEATISFQQQKDVACHKSEYDPDGPNANIILFQDTKWEYQGVDNTLAKTTVSYDTETGEILDADIELNHAYNEYTTGDDYVVYDVQSILTHEIGHFIGLDHTLDYNATMNAGYQQGTTELRTLELDDIEGICVIYPPSRDVVCDAEPNGGFSGECSGVVTDGEDGGCTIGTVALAPPSTGGRGSDGAPTPLPRRGGFAIGLALASLVALRRRRPTTDKTSK